MRTISLRKFRTEVADLTDKVEVSRRDGDGNIHLLGFWTPYKGSEPVLVRESGQETLVPLALAPPGPKIISSPEEAAAVAPQGVRAVPKPSQRRKAR